MMTKPQQLEIEGARTVPLHLMGVADPKDLKPHPKNYVEHPEDQIEHLKTSLVNNGFYRNIVVANDNTILCGHGIWLAAQALEMKLVPVIKLDLDPNSDEALKLLIGDNEVRHLVMTDDRLMADTLIDISREGGSLEGTGWDQMMLANFAMITRHKEEIQDLKHAMHWMAMPGFERVFRPLTMTIHVRTEEDRMKVLELLGLQGSKITKRMVLWWPPAAVQRPMDLKLVPDSVSEDSQVDPEGPSPLELSMMDETEDHEIEVYGGLGTDEVEVNHQVVSDIFFNVPEQDPAPPEPEPSGNDTPAIEENHAPEVAESPSIEASEDLPPEEMMTGATFSGDWQPVDESEFPMTRLAQKEWTFGESEPDQEPLTENPAPADRYTS